MQLSIHTRLFQRLKDVIPNLETVSVGADFYAPPRMDGDLAMYCSVSKVSGAIVEIELINGHGVNLHEESGPWMVFRIDRAAQTAELLVLQDTWRYEVLYSDADRPNPRRAALSLYACNWLTLIANLYVSFTPVGALAEAQA